MFISSTTAAELRAPKRVRSLSFQRGQSMLEFAFLMPVIVILVMILIDTEIAMSIGIVNQKYTRAQLHFLTFNHRQYPERSMTKLRSASTFMRRYWVGMDSKDNYTGTDIHPVALTRRIGPKPAPADDETPRGISARQNVRIRTLSFTCVPPLGYQLDRPFSEDNLGEDTFVGMGGGAFKFCGKER